MLLPPTVQCRAQFGLAGLDALVGGDQRLEVRLGHAVAEIQVGVVPLGEYPFWRKSVRA